MISKTGIPACQRVFCDSLFDRINRIYRMTRQSGSSKYCLDCCYCLDHLESNECPECGRGFDPGDPKTYSNSPHRLTLPRWEFFVAAFLLATFVIQSNRWYEVQSTVWGRRLLVHWLYEYGPVLYRFEKIFYAAPFVCLIPVFAVSAYRARPRCLVNVLCCLGCVAAFLAWPGTHIWFADMIEVVPEVHRIDRHLDEIYGTSN